MSADFYLDKFLRVSQDTTLPDGEKVTVRVLSDLEMNARRDYAIAESVRITEQLKDPGSELYRTKIAPLADAGKEALINILADARRMELVREALDIYRFDFFPYPENATEQEQVETRLKQTEHEKAQTAKRAEHIIKGEAAYREKMDALPFDVLIKETQARAQQVYAISVANDAETYYTVWCSVEIDGHKKWATPQEVGQLPFKVIDHLYDLYRKVDAIDPWALTKSEPAGEPAGLDEKRPARERQSKRSAR